MSKKMVLLNLLVVTLVLGAIGLHALPPPPQSAVATALTNQQARKAFEAQASAVGLSCTSLNEYACREMIRRAERNPELKKVLLQTGAHGIIIFADSWPWFNAGSVSKYGWIEINALTSDEKIVAFLTK